MYVQAFICSEQGFAFSHNIKTSSSWILFNSVDRDCSFSEPKQPDWTKDASMDKSECEIKHPCFATSTMLSALELHAEMKIIRDANRKSLCGGANFAGCPPQLICICLVDRSISQWDKLPNQNPGFPRLLDPKFRVIVSKLAGWTGKTLSASGHHNSCHAMHGPSSQIGAHSKTEKTIFVLGKTLCSHIFILFVNPRVRVMGLVPGRILSFCVLERRFPSIQALLANRSSLFCVSPKISRTNRLIQPNNIICGREPRTCREG